MITKDGTVFEECFFGIKTAEGNPVVGSALAAGELKNAPACLRAMREAGFRALKLMDRRNGRLAKRVG